MTGFGGVPTPKEFSMSGGAELDGGLGSSARGGVHASVDLNDFSFNSKMSGMSLEDDDWKNLAHGPDDGFRMSPKDAWVRDKAAATMAAAAAINGTMPMPAAGGAEPHGNWASAMNSELGATHSAGTIGRSSRDLTTSVSLDEADWDMIAQMAPTPGGVASKRSPMNAYRLGRTRSGTASARQSGGTSTKGANGAAAPATGAFTFEDYAPERIAERQRQGGAAIVPSKSSAGVDGQIISPGLTPRAQALMQINAAYKAGKISKEQKQIQKQQILHGGGDEVRS